MITAVELSLLLGGADGNEQAEAVQDLIERGLSMFVIESGSITGMQNTREGNERLSAMTLPVASA